MKVDRQRIAILDGFRAIAIIAVIFYHFFSRYTPPHYKQNLYPYENQFDFFSYGYLGVHFFFIISGFVIFFTLEITTDFISFWKKRFIRLWPSMFFASLFIFLFFFALDKNYDINARIKDFFISITFINPVLINNFFSLFHIKSSFSYLNGSFWSLWVEIQFYFYVSIIYFINKRNFIYIFLLLSICLSIINVFIHNLSGSNILQISDAKYISDFYIKWFDEGFNLLNYLPFFATGVIYYKLFKEKKSAHQKNPLYLKFFLLFFIVFEITFGNGIQEKIAFFVMNLLFLGFIYFPKYFSLFEKSFMVKTGQASYFLYLIHENTGVFLIATFGSYFMPYGSVFSLCIIVFFIITSVVFTKHIDEKFSKWLKKKIL